MAATFTFTANGEATLLEGIIPIEVAFEIDVTSGTPVSYLWDFGDGTTNETYNPTHTYNTYGYHRVYLTVTDDLGDQTTQVMNIILGRLTFEAQPALGDKPLTVEFNNTSIAPSGYQFENWIWDFGDPTGVTGAGGITGPSHIYGDYGSYNVSVYAKMSD